MHITALHVYPVKGMRAVDLPSATVEARGLRNDRRWLAVDANGKFLTQRSHAHMARIAVTTTATGIELSAEGFADIVVDRPSGDRRRRVTVWDTEVDAAAVDDTVDLQLSELLDDDAHLVFMDEKAERMKASVWTTEPVAVSFADAFPILVATTGSLSALNREIESTGGATIPMSRFRPNVVVECDEPWAEDRWRRLETDKITLDLVKPSDRCIVTTTDQTTGERRNKEPLASLARIHRSTDPRIKGVLFGVNCVPRTCGELRVGDAVRIVD